jgi:uncharacterized protein YggE
MKKSWLLVAGFILTVGIIGLTGCEQGGTTPGEITNLNLNSQQQGIWVNGEGKVSAVPDIATLSLGIEAEETSVAEAQTQASEAMDKVMNALKDNGLAEKDIQTQYFNIYQVTKWDPETQEQVVTGYRVTNMVTAKIRNIDKVGTIIDAVVAAGGDLTRIDNINFSVDDPSPYYEEARKEAMANAKTKANQLAELANVTLGKPTYISENSYYTTPIRSDIAYKMEEAVVAETPISPGEMEISVSIQIAYEIK